MKPTKAAIGWGGETEFEKRRGVSSVEVRLGYAQVHVSHLENEIVDSRLKVLHAISEAGISLDFLKLTPSGLAFLVSESRAEALESALTSLNVRHSIKPNRAILLVHAVSIRDEEGVLAQIVHAAISSGAKIDHISDMHDRLLMVVDSKDANRVRDSIHAKEAALAN